MRKSEVVKMNINVLSSFMQDLYNFFSREYTSWPTVILIYLDVTIVCIVFLKEKK